MIGPEEVQRHVRLITHDPAIMRCGWNVKQISGAHLGHAAVRKSCGGTSADHQADVLDAATVGANRWSHVFGPAPTGLVRGTAERAAGYGDQLEFSLDEVPNLVGFVEALENYVNRGRRHVSLSLGLVIAQLLRDPEKGSAPLLAAQALA
jgi:hypothetical protein